MNLSKGVTTLFTGGPLATPASGTLTNCTGLPIAGTTGYGTGVATALAVNVGSAGAFLTFNGNAGTPSALVGTNITGTAASLTAGNVTTNANLTGHVTSVGNAAVLGSFTLAQLNTAVSDADVAQLGANTLTGAQTLTGASPQLTLGVLNTTAGAINFKGSTSGDVTLKGAAAAGASVTVTLPATSVTLNAAGDLTGTTLNSGVTASSLTSVGTLTALAVTSAGDVTGPIFRNSVQSVLLKLSTPGTAATDRNWAFVTNYTVHGDWLLRVGASQDSDPITGGTTVISATSAGAVTIPGTMGVTGALTAASLSTGSGAISGGAGTFSGALAANGNITSTGTGLIYDNRAAGTTYKTFILGNTSGDIRFGIEGSAGGDILTGSTAYAGVINVAVAKSLHFGTSDAVRMTIASGGGVTIASLAGTGTRTVVVDANGLLSAP